jgi:hypothetical protein
MASIQVNVTIGGETHSLKVSKLDEVRFERDQGIGIPKAFSDGEIRVEYAYRLAWHTCTRAKVTTKPFDDFLEDLEDIELNFNEGGSKLPLDASGQVEAGSSPATLPA